MVAECRGYDALVTAVQRKSSEEELRDAHKIAGRKSSVEERLAGGSVGVEEQMFVNGPFGISHWKRCRVHQETDCGHCTDGVECNGGRRGDDCGNGGPPINDRGDGRGARDRRVDHCGRVERRWEGCNAVDTCGGRSGECGGDCGDRGACHDDYCSCAVFSSRDDRDQECGGGREFHDQMDHGHWVTSAPCGMFAGSLMGSVANLEHPPSGGLGWTETDLKENVLELAADDLDEKIINDGVEAKRFKVRAWCGVHMSQSGQEIPAAQCDDKDSDIRRIDNEECVVKDWRHTHTRRSNVKQRGETGMDAIRGEDEAMGYSI